MLLFFILKKVTKKKRAQPCAIWHGNAVNNLTNAVNNVTKSVDNSVYNSLIN